MGEKRNITICCLFLVGVYEGTPQRQKRPYYLKEEPCRDPAIVYGITPNFMRNLASPMILKGPVFLQGKSSSAVDGSNPTPVGGWILPAFIGLHPSQLVQKELSVSGTHPFG